MLLMEKTWFTVQNPFWTYFLSKKAIPFSVIEVLYKSIALFSLSVMLVRKRPGARTTIPSPSPSISFSNSKLCWTSNEIVIPYSLSSISFCEEWKGLVSTYGACLRVMNRTIFSAFDPSLTVTPITFLKYSSASNSILSVKVFSIFFIPMILSRAKLNNGWLFFFEPIKNQRLRNSFNK